VRLVTRQVPRPVAATAYAVIVAVGVWLLAEAAVVLVELLLAGERPSPLPPPTSWWVRGPLFLVAAAAGVWTFHRRLRRPVYGDGREPGTPVLVALGVLAVVLASQQAYAYAHERQYLSDYDKHGHLSDIETSGYRSADVLADGHAACDWLRAKRWGEPLGAESAERSVQANWAPAVPIKSTAWLYAQYVFHLAQQAPGPMTARDERRAQVGIIAWYDLCPFQQWVHRPVYGSSD
jgi:hypothetical protein